VVANKDGDLETGQVTFSEYISQKVWVHFV
jgi:hypothetical protein